MALKNNLIFAATFAAACESDIALKSIEIEDTQETQNVEDTDIVITQTEPSHPTTTTETKGPLEMSFADIRKMCSEAMSNPVYLPIDPETRDFEAEANAERTKIEGESLANFVAGVNDYFDRTDLTLEDIDNLEVPMGIWAEAAHGEMANLRISPGDQSEFYDGWHWAIDEELEEFPILACGVKIYVFDEHALYAAVSTAAYTGAEAFTLESSVYVDHLEHKDISQETLSVNNTTYDCITDYICVAAKTELESYGENFYSLAEKLVIRAGVNPYHGYATY